MSHSLAFRLRHINLWNVRIKVPCSGLLFCDDEPMGEVQKSANRLAAMPSLVKGMVPICSLNGRLEVGRVGGRF